MDKFSRCLLDTGSQVSLWPPTFPTSSATRSRVQLMAANGTLIPAFGHQTRTIKIGEKSYTFVFLMAIRIFNRPIIGLDFLQRFGMSLHLSNRRLIHADRSSTRFSSASSLVISGVNVIQTSPFTRLLADFPEITNVALASSSSKHGVECFIETMGPPIRMAPRRLTPEKLKIVKEYFELMCTAGICRRSNLP